MKKHKKNGFTLIELLIAIFILTVGILGIMAIFPMASRIEKSNQIITVATQLAQGKAEEILYKPYNEITVGTTTENYGSISNFNSFKRIAKVNYYDPENSTIASSDLGIKQIEITVYWESPLGNSERSTAVISLVSKR